MGHYIDPNGNYYEGDRQGSDIEVPERPSAFHHLVNGSWQFDRDAWLNAEIRPIRNRLLDQADLTYCNADRWEMMTAEQKAAWRVYKQVLRNLPTTISYEDPVWPEMPA